MGWSVFGLLEKNRINYFRTPFGSIAEVLFPGVLMLVLVYVRLQTKPEQLNYEFLKYLWHPIYPVSKPAPLTGETKV